ncbi:hypothetical protein [Persicirhabdus sediminis]|uniref:Uncharacterized protein n=1 Tax=Persicirhabdus sediminis TaxID=454144 RepID=A0A8J7MEQ3_9BACT|nr:hypothetical protein [Persicirhabdus sediminis]MBK1791961.1 hypothetical protein [Persicirhabdus sediminis]
MPSPKHPACPHCASSDIAPSAKKYRLYPSALVSIFGFVLAIFHRASLSNNYLCNDCLTPFSRRSKAAGCYYALFILGLIPLALFSSIIILTLLLGR